MEKLISLVPYSDLLKEFVSFYLTEYGKIKLTDISNKVHTSKKVQKFVIKASNLKIQLGTDDFVGAILSSMHFSIAKAETIAAASIVLLCKWEQDVGKPNGIADDIYLNKMFFNILDKCNRFKTHISGSSNFFENFFLRLEEVLNNSLQIGTTVDESSHEIFISFDSKMIEAIKMNIKTEFRITDNLDVVNLAPDEWKFTGWENEKGAILTNNQSNQNIIINFPYMLDAILKIKDLATAQVENLYIKIDSAAVRRIQNFDQYDAVKEGINIYKNEIKDIYAEDYAADAEVEIFKMNWRNKYGTRSLTKNYWVWVYGFNLYT